MEFLSTVCVDTNKVKKTVVCKTLADNSISLLTITNFSSQKQIIQNRPIIILTARIHPGYMLI